MPEVARFWRIQAQLRRLVGEECQNCEEKIFPPRDLCPRCSQESGTTLQLILKSEGVYTHKEEKQEKLSKETLLGMVSGYKDEAVRRRVLTHYVEQFSDKLPQKQADRMVLYCLCDADIDLLRWKGEEWDERLLEERRKESSSKIKQHGSKEAGVDDYGSK
ncbi:zinc ribbon domain-containing protein [Patescibacteria group bacterium]|nr:zinc ribbon domain-containing protein [Patescibacteria group bacterium]